MKLVFCTLFNLHLFQMHFVQVTLCFGDKYRLSHTIRVITTLLFGGRGLYHERASDSNHAYSNSIVVTTRIVWDDRLVTYFYTNYANELVHFFAENIRKHLQKESKVEQSRTENASDPGRIKLDSLNMVFKNCFWI